jgi:ATP-dependent RNA helicase DHX29
MAPPFRDLFKKWKTYEFDQAEKKIQSNAEELNDFINNLLTKTPNFSSKNIKVVSETKIPKERSKSVFSREEYAKKIDSIGYREYEQIRKHLPAYSKKQDLVKMINENRVVIISGETGSGKSTQVPQFIFEDCVSRGVEFNLICTEPRRISAISLASRVSIELNDRLGNLVGYQVKNDSRKSQNTRITYCTTGLFLKQIDDISDVTHIVVDEVHERTLDSDFLLCLLKKLDVKIILMSASADSIKFSEYFGGAPVFVIPGKAYEVQDFYLEHVVGVTNYNSVDDEYSNREYNEVVVKGKGGKVYESGEKYEKKILDVEDIVDMMDMRKINYELISLLVKHIVVIKPAGSSVNDSESILIFLPGIHEIQRLYDVLSNDFAESPTQKHRLLILQLHGQMSNEKQSQVFDPPASGYTKVVLSTNVAETGITIPDIVYVIDTMTAREISFDQKRGINRLLTVPISKANAKQRKGRAGRTKPGISYHLIPKHQFQKLLSQRPPESVRLPIEEICLKYKVFRKGGLLEMFMEMIDPPPKKHIDTAILLLRHLEAFDHEENLTEIGMFLAVINF